MEIADMPKRDMDLIRKILFDVESQPSKMGWYDPHIENKTEEDISYHVQLAQDAGLIEAIDLSTLDGPCWRPVRLTSQGHDFIEAACNETFWKQAKQNVLQKTGSLTVETLKIALAELLRRAVTGVS
jgi:hypothetical protein